MGNGGSTITESKWVEPAPGAVDLRAGQYVQSLVQLGSKALGGESKDRIGNIAPCLAAVPEFQRQTNNNMGPSVRLFACCIEWMTVQFGAVFVFIFIAWVVSGSGIGSLRGISWVPLQWAGGCRAHHGLPL